MRLLFIAAMACTAIASCAAPAKPVCELRPDGVRLYIGSHTEAYSDIVALLRDGKFQELVASAPAMNTYVNELTTAPTMCQGASGLRRAIGINYSPRSRDHVGAILELHFDEAGRTKVAEFQVVPLAM